MTLDLADLNVRAAIAFGLALIAALLTYIAFFKDSVENKRSSKTSKVSH
jgi:hypothetical protein